MPHCPRGSRIRPLFDRLADGLLSLLVPDEDPSRQGPRRIPLPESTSDRTGYGCYEPPTYRRRGVRIRELEPVR
jgi:hypothetical protein